MKKLAYISGSRAEYGIVKRLLLLLQADTTIQFSLIVTAMHLSERFGNTLSTIESDRLNVAHKIPIAINNQNNAGIIATMAECLEKFGKHFQEHRYDAVIVLGDRYEIFSVATAAAIHDIPIIHLHGGEQTLGNYDEFIRHSITKMAKLHLTATETYRQRVIQLGEKPDTVFNIGSLGAENGLSLSLPLKTELLQSQVISENPYFVVVFHPETLNASPILEQINQLLESIDAFKEKFDFLFVGSNSDTGSDIIFEKFNQYAEKNNFKIFTSLSPEQYLALIKYSQGIIGNSSSGLLEAPSLQVGTVNIGNRQQGRVRGDSVIDVRTEKQEIIAGINQLLSRSFQEKLPKMLNPYYCGSCLDNAYSIILDFIQNRHAEPKSFFDINNENIKR